MLHHCGGREDAPVRPCTSWRRGSMTCRESNPAVSAGKVLRQSPAAVIGRDQETVCGLGLSRASVAGLHVDCVLGIIVCHEVAQGRTQLDRATWVTRASLAPCELGCAFSHRHLFGSLHHIMRPEGGGVGGVGGARGARRPRLRRRGGAPPRRCRAAGDGV